MGPSFWTGQEPQLSLFDLSLTPQQARLVVVAVPWEASTSFRPGTFHGPEAVLRASVQVDLYDPWLGSPEEHGLALLPPDPQLLQWHAQALDALRQNRPEQADLLAQKRNRWVEHTCQELWQAGKVVVILGGEHGVSLGAIRAAVEHWGPLGVLQVDAHADLRPQYQGMRFSHACFAARVLELEGVVRLVQLAVRDLCRQEAQRMTDDSRICTFLHAHWKGQLQQVVEALPARVWISWDIDGLEPALCPNTGTPVPGGLRWEEATELLRMLVQSGRQIVGADLCEVAPEPGRPLGQGWDEIVGAQFLYRLCGWTLASQGIHRPNPLEHRSE